MTGPTTTTPGRGLPLTGSYPVNLDLSGRPVLVVGAGSVGARKVGGLLRAGAIVSVVAPRAVSDIADEPDIRWYQRSYRRGEVASYRLGIAATDDPTVNAEVAADGERAGVFVNSADDPANCSFTLPAIARAGDVQMAISTNGRSPALARWLRRWLERELTGGIEQLLEVVSDVRAEARDRLGTSENAGWDSAFDDGLLTLVRAGHVEAARQMVREHLGLSRADPPPTALSEVAS